jgi:large subunit ribosomal protein L5
MLDDTQPQVESEDQPESPSEVTGEILLSDSGETKDEILPSDSGEAKDGDQPQASTEETEAPKVEDQTPKAPRRQRSTSGGRSRRGQQAVAAEPAEAPQATEGPPPPRLRKVYQDEIVPALMREFGYTNPMRAPRIQKVVLNIGVGDALTDNRAMEGSTKDLTTISGQKPIINRARKSIAGFKLREGNPIGTSVTLRGARMYHFLDRFINMALPRIRDFRGIQRTGFDGRGNFSIGIREQIIFPEIDYNQIDRIRGLQVTIATSARNDTEAIRLLELYGMPFVRQA